MASQDRSCKYIESLTEGPSLTSGCGMACCPWTAYACNERTALRGEKWHSDTTMYGTLTSLCCPWCVTRTKLDMLCVLHQLLCSDNVDNQTLLIYLSQSTFLQTRVFVVYLTTCKDDRRAGGFGPVWDGHSFWWRLKKTVERSVKI